VIDLFVGHLRVQRKMQRVPRDAFGGGSTALPQAPAAVPAEQVARPVKAIDAVDAVFVEQPLAELRRGETGSGLVHD